MESTVSLCKPFGCGTQQLIRQNRVMRRRAGRQAGERSFVTQAAAHSGAKSLVAKWAESAGLRTNVSLEDFLGDRCYCGPLLACLKATSGEKCLRDGCSFNPRHQTKLCFSCFPWQLATASLPWSPPTCIWVLVPDGATVHNTTVCRTESLKAPPNGPVTWPSEQWTSMWKVRVPPRLLS